MTLRVSWVSQQRLLTNSGGGRGRNALRYMTRWLLLLAPRAPAKYRRVTGSSRKATVMQSEDRLGKIGDLLTPGLAATDILGT